jgi:hypothetical protein
MKMSAELSEALLRLELINVEKPESGFLKAYCR